MRRSTKFQLVVGLASAAVGGWLLIVFSSFNRPSNPAAEALGLASGASLFFLGLLLGFVSLQHKLQAGPRWMPLWLAGVLTLVLALVGWSVWLIVSAHNLQAEASDNVKLIRGLGELQQSVFRLHSALQPETPGEDRTCWRNHGQLSAAASRHSVADRVRDQLERADAAVQRMRELADQLVRNGSVGQPGSQRAFQTFGRQAIQELEMAVSRMRQRNAEITTNLVGKWQYLDLLALFSGISTLALVLLCGVYQQNVARRRQVEHALGESEAWLHAAVGNVPCDFWACNSQGRLVRQNASSIRHFGLHLGQGIAELDLPPDARRQLHEQVQQALAGRIVQEEVHFPVDGRMSTWIRILSPIHVQGSVQGVLGVHFDITERRAAAQREREHVAELAHVARLSAMGKLVSELAHEINQPLYAIANFAEASINTLRRENDGEPSEVCDWMQQIAQQANRAGEILRRVGRFVSKSPPKRVRCNLNGLVTECLQIMHVDIRKAAAGIRLDLQADLPDIEADRIQIEQVLVNLLKNALDSLRDNASAGREIGISSRELENDLVEIAVRDTGGGVLEEDQQRLFEPFFTTRPDGMGMGLAISRSIIETHRGCLVGEPNAEGGMTFRFTLSSCQETAVHAC